METGNLPTLAKTCQNYWVGKPKYWGGRRW